MSRVEAIESEIKELSAAKFAELREWLLDQDAEARDRRLESGAKSVRPDALSNPAEVDRRTGLPIPQLGVFAEPAGPHLEVSWTEEELDELFEDPSHLLSNEFAAHDQTSMSSMRLPA